MNFPGNCYYNHKKKLMWLDIPKNASKSISHHLWNSSDWKNGNYIEDNVYDYKAYAVIRDPIRRWRGSTIEIAFHHLQFNDYDYSKVKPWFERNRYFRHFETIGDLHHQPMSYFISKDLKDVNWIVMDDSNFEQRIREALGINEPLQRINTTKENEHKKLLEPYVEEVMKDGEFIEKLMNYYAEDYEILKRAKEYA